MKSLFKSLVIGLALLAAIHVAYAQTTIFSYQGRLSAGGVPTDGTFEMTFQLFDDPVAGGAVSLAQTHVCAVSNGLFTTLLDFGREPFTGQNLWLGIGVRTNSNEKPFTVLSPRQYLAMTPYALRAAGAGAADTVTGAVAAASLTGVLSDAVLPANLARVDEDTMFTGRVDFTHASNSFRGQFAGNAAGLTNINLGAATPPGAITTNSFILTNLTSAPADKGPAGMALADFNGDGWPDLAVANSGTNFLTVSTNDRQGGFVLRDMPAVGDSPVNVLAGEVNGDGQTDLMVAQNGGVLTLLTNDGSGRFSVVSSVTAPATLSTMATADFNRDGLADVVCGFNDNQPLQVYLNDGFNHLVLRYANLMTNEYRVLRPVAVAAGDMNGDTWPDLVVGDNNEGFTILTNNTAGGFGLYWHTILWSYPSVITVCDFNRDGRLDVAIGCHSFAALKVGYNQADGSLSFFNLFPASPSVSQVAAGDVNADGWPDLVAIRSGSLYVFTNNASGGLVTHSIRSCGYSTPIYISDINQNGYGEVLYPNSSRVDILHYRAVMGFNGAFSGTINSSLLINPVLTNQVTLQGDTVLKVGNGSIADEPNTGLTLRNTNGGVITLKAANAIFADGPLIVWSDRGVDLNNADGPMITRRFDAFDFNAPEKKRYLGRWGMFLEPMALTLGIPNLADRYFQFVKYNTDGTFAQLASLDQNGSFGLAGSLLTPAVAIQNTGALELGKGLTKEENAGKITYGQWTPDTLEITGGGVSSASRKIRFWAEGGASFSGPVRVESDTAIRLNAADRPIIVRDFDPFDAAAPNGKAGIGRWGLFMEPSSLVLGMPDNAGGAIRFAKYNVNGTSVSLAHVDANGNLFTAGAVNPPSDRHVKQDFATVDPLDVLARVARLPLQTWCYTNNPLTRHIGPVAQDFHAAFGLGADDKHISTVDADGVALAAIQGLNQKLEDRSQKSETRSQKLEAENAELKRELAELKALVQRLAVPKE